jgi:hypothetical protein
MSCIFIIPEAIFGVFMTLVGAILAPLTTRNIRVFQKGLYNGTPNVGVSVDRWTVCTPLSVKRFANTRQTVTFGIPL